MIFDKTENLFNYVSLLPALLQVRKQLEELLTNSEKLTLGRHDLSEKVYINVMEYQTKSKSESFFEAHKDYADIQILLKGQEFFYAAEKSWLKITKEYCSDTDCLFLEGKPQTRSLLSAGCFVIAFPNDAHMPSIQAGDSEIVRKAVIKVLL